MRARSRWPRRSRALNKALLIALIGLAGVVTALPPRPARAAEVGRFIAEHLAFDVAAVGGWRSSWAENRNPGFTVAGGGGELNIGLELDNGLGVLIGGRAMAQGHVGEDTTLDGLYVEAVGQALIQLRVIDWVRVGLGADAGRFWRCCGPDVESAATSALLFGGFLRIGVDFLPLPNLPRALSLWLRIGVDGHQSDDLMTTLPSVSMNMAVGVGLRL